MLVETKRNLLERVFFIDGGRIYNGVITKIEVTDHSYFSPDNGWRRDNMRINFKVNYNLGTSAEGECSNKMFSNESHLFTTKQEAGLALLKANGLDVSLMEVK